MTTVALVTGANTGIGFEAVRGLLQKGMIVYLAARDAAKGEAATAELASEGDVRFVRIDRARYEQGLGRSQPNPHPHPHHG